ncbi:MAG: sporulation protein YqfD [Eubacteriales bacterium]
MLKGLRQFFCGWRDVTVSAECAAEVFDIMYKNGIAFEREKRLDSGGISFTVRESGWKILSSEAEKRCICLNFSSVHGLPQALNFMKKRPMLPAGFLVFLIWMSYSSKIIWDIKIEGNTKTDSAEIISLLDELGCGIGDYYPKINFNQLHADYAAKQHDIAWLSVFMNGTVAEVQVRELYADTREKHPLGTYANVVAGCDGIVEDINVFEGQACVVRGQLVRKGQVLISGVVEGKDGEFRYEYAAGEVKCKTSDSVSEKVSLIQQKKVYTGREKTKYSIKIFKNSINLFIKGGIEYSVYDKIDMIEKLCPFGLCEVPVWINKTVYREYELVDEEISADDAGERAMTSLNEKIRALTSDAELEYKEMRSGFVDGEYTLECMLYLSRDIGVTREFTVGENNTQQ